jgi:hypothetical protein
LHIRSANESNLTSGSFVRLCTRRTWPVRQPIVAAGGAPAGLGYTARPDHACAPTPSMTSILRAQMPGRIPTAGAVPIAIGRLQRAERSCLRFAFVAADIRQPWLEAAARLASSAGSAIPDFASLNPGYGLVSWRTRAQGELAKRNQPHPRRGRHARGLR